MYAGEIVENGEARAVIENAKHPYTQLLIEAAPDPAHRTAGALEDAVFTGEPPDLSAEITGCPFQFRCFHVHQKCKTTRPNLVEVEDHHQVKCHLYDER
jgi:peptide/nickel transport system ATP-binding protein